MFDINFEDENRERKMVWQNSWGLTTRTVNLLFFFHLFEGVKQKLLTELIVLQLLNIIIFLCILNYFLPSLHQMFPDCRSELW